ncbi:MAG: hypothetical protein Q8O14_03145 [bacterium]|jgi:hypothetical protein|nr:hypothetical protein [bacterium]
MSSQIAHADTAVTTIQPSARVEPVYIKDSAPPAEILVPVTFFLVVFGAAVLSMYFRFRTRRLNQEERLRAMELHIPIPPEPQRARGNPYIMPMLLIGCGLGLLVLWANLQGDDRVVALGFSTIGLFAGLAWLAAIWFNSGARERQERLAELETQAYVAAMERAVHPPAPPQPPVPPVL